MENSPRQVKFKSVLLFRILQIRIGGRAVMRGTADPI